MAWRTLEGRAVRTGQLVAGRHRQPPAVLHSAHDLHGGGRIRVKGGAAFSKPESGASSSAGAGSRSTSQHWLCAPSTGFACPRGTPRSAAPTAQRQMQSSPRRGWPWRHQTPRAPATCRGRAARQVAHGLGSGLLTGGAAAVLGGAAAVRTARGYAPPCHPQPGAPNQAGVCLPGVHGGQGAVAHAVVENLGEIKVRNLQCIRLQCLVVPME